MSGEPPSRPADRPRAREAPPTIADDRQGDRIIMASWVGTAVFGVVATAATISSSVFQALLVLVCVALFIVGFFSGFVAYVLAIRRSRTDAIGMGGLFFLLGTAPTRVRRNLMGAFGVQILVAVVTASVGLLALPVDATNVLAFGVLTPLFGLGLAGLWGARYGTFSPRADRAG